MSANQDLVTRYVDAFNRGDLEGVCALFSPDALIWGVMGWGAVSVARPVWKDLIECLRMQLTVEDLICVGDTAAARYTERGTSAQAFRGLGPTGKSYEVTAMEWFVLKDGLIHRRWGARDSAAIFRQLGLPLP
ncbi:MAG TPA: nuclear transport factor 2 family protein [Steroidobacteraceae bacterium]|nr:nuclear transport factor 2 family protein [Steroidobacteraceae bacterium]